MMKSKMASKMACKPLTVSKPKVSKPTVVKPEVMKPGKSPHEMMLQTKNKIISHIKRKTA